MSYSIEVFEGEPIILVTLNADFDLETEGEASIGEAMTLLATAPEPVYYINDLRAATFDFMATVQGSNMAARGENPIFHHPNVKQVILITNTDIQNAAAKGMGSSTFGGANIVTFNDIAAALDYARNNEA